MTIAGELINILGFKIEGEDQLRRYNKQLDDTEEHGIKTREGVRQLGVAAGVAATGMIALGTQGVKNFAAFERQMNRIGITAGATENATRQASDAALQMAEKFAMPIEQVATGLDTLVSSGMNLEQAMAFLPSILATAQASGAATEDIANTAIKAAGALKIEAADMQRAFDVMVAGGKAGQFELKDMASYIPTLANQFADLGYTGEDGLKRLIAILQTVREDTGSAGQAATQVQNVFSKMFSAETEKNFKDFGVNIREEMASAKAAGEDAIGAYIRLTQQVLDKNPKAKLSDLFTDQEFQAGMRSLLNSTDSLEKFMNAVNSAEVSGTVFRDLNRILGDTESSITRLSTSWDTFMKSIGEAAADPVSSVLDNLTGSVSKNNAMNTALESQGMDFWQRRVWELTHGAEEQERMARRGGYARTEQEQRDQREAPYAYEALGRRPNRPTTATPDHAAEAAAARAAEAIKAQFDAPIILNVDAYDQRLATPGVNPDRRKDDYVAPTAPEDLHDALSKTFGGRGVFQEGRSEAPVSLERFWNNITSMFDMSARADEGGERVPFDTPLTDGASNALDAFTAAVQRSTSAIDPKDYDTGLFPGGDDPRLKIDPKEFDTGLRPMQFDDSNQLEALAGQVSAINSNLAQMTGTAPVNATITDARQDNRAFPMSVNTSITQNITEAQAPTAAGQATGAAVNSAATNQAARIQQEPAF